MPSSKFGISYIISGESEFDLWEEIVQPMVVHNVTLRSLDDGQLPPRSFETALLDTGAKMSTAPDHLLRKWGFPACGKTSYTVPGNSTVVQTDVFAVWMDIPFLQEKALTKVMGIPDTRNHLLIGRNTMRDLKSVLITDWGRKTWWWGANVTHTCIGTDRRRLGFIRPC